MSVNKEQYLLIDTNAVDYYIQQRFSPARLCPETGNWFVLMGHGQQGKITLNVNNKMKLFMQIYESKLNRLIKHFIYFFVVDVKGFVQSNLTVFWCKCNNKLDKSSEIYKT